MSSCFQVIAACVAPRAVVGLVYLAALLVTPAAGQPLPDTQPLTASGDLASAMVEGIDRFLLAETAAEAERRAARWQRDLSSHAAYDASVAENRKRLARYLGVVDERVAPRCELIATLERPSLVAKTPRFEAHAVRWSVLPGVDAEGYLLRPLGEIAACVVAVPDADQTPEAIIGLSEGSAPEAQFARRLAEARCLVLVPTVIDRKTTHSSGNYGQAKAQIPHREWLYRQAFEMGRHVLGYEAQEVLAAVDVFSSLEETKSRPIGVIGYGEGALVAMYAAALDTRIDGACVCGALDDRQNVWQEPIYRNVFGLLTEFGDAETASLVAPRGLVVEAGRMPQVDGRLPRAERPVEPSAPGRIATPPLEQVRGEFERARALVAGLEPAPRWTFVASGNGDGPPATGEALQAFAELLGVKDLPPAPSETLAFVAPLDDAEARHKRQLDQLVEFTQTLLRDSERTRDAFWSKAERQDTNAAQWLKTTAEYRKYFYDEVIGRFDRPLLPANPRSRKVYDEPLYTGYEVMLDVFPDVFAYGILLLPKDIKPGERRPVVVCQHGLEGRPQDVAQKGLEHRAYHDYACRLAEQGFVVYAPQNPYIFSDRFRALQRKANPIKKTLFSIIVPQHQQTVDWLAGLPMVDAERIAFYGLSYGGKTAMRVPALVDGYCLSICSADFNEWIWKNTSTRSAYSYVHRGEYEIFEFDLGNTFNYAEMAALIAPRPFMVERGHRDGVSDDSHVAYEYAKVRLLYADLGIEDRTEIEFFEGPHEIHGVGTFAFLHKHLRWPER